MLKDRELNILATFLRKIEQHKKATLSVSLVQEMKALFPEVTTEMLHALFVWTAWMAERATTTLDVVPVEHSSTSVVEESESSVVFSGGDLSNVCVEMAPATSECAPDISVDVLSEVCQFTENADDRDPVLPVVVISSPSSFLMSDSDDDRHEEETLLGDHGTNMHELDVTFPELCLLWMSLTLGNDGSY